MQASMHGHVTMVAHRPLALSAREASKGWSPMVAMKRRARNAPARWRSRAGWFTALFKTQPPVPPVPPVPLPEGWQAFIDEASGAPYYISRNGTSTWVRPDGSSGNLTNAEAGSPTVEMATPLDRKPRATKPRPAYDDGWAPRSVRNANKQVAFDSGRALQQTSRQANRMWNVQSSSNSSAWSARRDPFEFRQTETPAVLTRETAPGVMRSAGLADNFRKAKVRSPAQDGFRRSEGG